jgi:SagB-type dehydrogenase family enzyme
MNLKTFIHHLHVDIDQASPPGWEVNWEDAPLPYKLYRGLPVVPLSAEVPLSLIGYQPGKPDLDRQTIGHFLWYVFGLTQLCQSALTLDSTETEQPPEPMHSLRRFAPSGGALYPNELYVYLKVKHLPAGVYHYDPAHHRLVLLREGHFDDYLSRALGNRCNLSACFGTVFVSTMFWKNFFKYHNFSYRLQGLDCGVLIGQLLEVAKRFNFETKVYFQFLDRALNHLLGLSDREENVYAVIPLAEEAPGSVTPFTDTAEYGNNRTRDTKEGESVERVAKPDFCRENMTSRELCRELPAIEPDHYVRSRKVADYSLLTKISEASSQEETRSFQHFETVNMEKVMENVKVKEVEGVYGDGQKATQRETGETFALPQVQRLTYDLAAVGRKRFSPDMDFVFGKISSSNLATLLQESMTSFFYRNDLDGKHNETQNSRVSLYVCMHQVEDIPDGAYAYDSDAHALRQIRHGDHRLRLHYGMPVQNVNLFQVPLCFHVVGDADHYISSLGYRGYRIQQMEAGMLVQRLLLTASALGLGGHPLLGYDVEVCDTLYKLNGHGQTSLIQIPVGPYRPRPWLKGSLHS